MPGDDERRPRPEAPPPTTSTTSQTNYARPDREAGETTRRRFCATEVVRRRKVSHQLDLVLAELYPQAPAVPSTFSLTDHELRRHANDLHAAGWPVEEIVSVLDIDPARQA
jgi:hypothetical protein